MSSHLPHETKQRLYDIADMLEAQLSSRLTSEEIRSEPRPKRPRAKQHGHRHLPSWEFSVLFIAVAVASGATVFWYDKLELYVIEHTTAQSALIGMVVCLATILWGVVEGAPFNILSTLIKTISGGVFGVLAAKAAVGGGLNADLQAVAAGVGGATGPKYIHKVVDRLSDTGSTK